MIIERLVRAAQRGVNVHIMARPPHTLKKDKLIEGVGGLRIMHDVGAKVHRLKDLKLHGKMLLADDKRAIVGSINLAPGSFDARRELAIETDAHHVVIASRKWRSTTGSIRMRSTSPTKGCSPIWRSATRPAPARKSSSSRAHHKKTGQGMRALRRRALRRAPGAFGLSCRGP